MSSSNNFCSLYVFQCSLISKNITKSSLCVGRYKRTFVYSHNVRHIDSMYRYLDNTHARVENRIGWFHSEHLQFYFANADKLS